MALVKSDIDLTFKKSARVPVSLTSCFILSGKCTDLELHKNQLHSSCYPKMEYRNCCKSDLPVCP